MPNSHLARGVLNQLQLIAKRQTSRIDGICTFISSSNGRIDAVRKDIVLPGSGGKRVLRWVRELELIRLIAEMRYALEQELLPVLNHCVATANAVREVTASARRAPPAFPSAKRTRHIIRETKDCEYSKNDRRAACGT